MQLVALAKNPVPGGAVVGELKGFDGVRLRFARWGATRGPRRGTVCLFGGRGEFIEKYFEVIADLRRRGFAVATMDWRGQGGSQRLLADARKGHVASFNDYDRDLRIFMREIALPDCPPPFYALAHSMGGHILLRHAQRPGSWFERMILVAPMIQIASERTGYPAWMVKAMAEGGCLAGYGQSFVPGGSGQAEEQRRFEGNVLTSDRERWMRNKAVLDVGPHLGLGAPTFGWMRAALRSMAAVADEGFPQTVTVPLLMFAAARDRVVSTRAIEDLAVSLKVGAHVLLPGSQHEILQEADAIRLRFWAAFDAYLGIGEHDAIGAIG